MIGGTAFSLPEQRAYPLDLHLLRRVHLHQLSTNPSLRLAPRRGAWERGQPHQLPCRFHPSLSVNMLEKRS